MDGFTGFKTATTEELPDAVAVMDPFHVVRLSGDALDQCRRRVQQAALGFRNLMNYIARSLLDRRLQTPLHPRLRRATQGAPTAAR